MCAEQGEDYIFISVISFLYEPIRYVIPKHVPLSNDVPMFILYVSFSNRTLI